VIGRPIQQQLRSTLPLPSASQPCPGIWDHRHLDSAITRPIGVDARPPAPRPARSAGQRCFCSSIRRIVNVRDGRDDGLVTTRLPAGRFGRRFGLVVVMSLILASGCASAPSHRVPEGKAAGCSTPVSLVIALSARHGRSAPRSAYADSAFRRSGSEDRGRHRPA
jgi:hypothetical protein